MKETNAKPMGRSQTGQGKSAEKPMHTTSSHTGSATRGTTTGHASRAEHTSRANNPAGHNQYTKKSETKR